IFWLIESKRGCSKSPVKMTLRISSLACFCAAHVSGKGSSAKIAHVLWATQKSAHTSKSAARNYAALKYLVLFILLFEHALKACLVVCNKLSQSWTIPRIYWWREQRA